MHMFTFQVAVCKLYENDLCFDNIYQNATECLATFISGGRQLMLVWGGDSGFTMRSLLDAASR